MAQVEKGARRGAERMRRVLAQRPVVMVLVLAVAVLGVGAAVLGVMWGQAEGVKIERSDTAAHRDDSTTGRDSDRASSSGKKREAATVMVDVGGAVRTPRVVSLPKGARVADAIEAAGGLAPDADLSTVNRAAPVQDGEKVMIPRVGETVAGDAADASGDSGSSQEGAGSAGTGTATGRVNINAATAEQLDELPGVGPATAQAIVEDRKANGPFVSVDDLMRVSGIGEKKFAKLKDLIAV